MTATGIVLLALGGVAMLLDSPFTQFSVRPRHGVYVLTVAAGVVLILIGIAMWAWKALP